MINYNGTRGDKMKAERIDKILSNAGYGSRKDVKEKIRKGSISIDGRICKDESEKVDVEAQKLSVDGKVYEYTGKYRYIMLNKAAGYISAVSDDRDKTVMDLIPEDMRCRGIAPVGRLDKDTEGLLILTNDGELSHRLMSPKYDIDKLYFAKTDKRMTQSDIDAFFEGITLSDGYKCKSAKLEILNEYEVLITISEGKFHQVKKMVAARGGKVTYLKRLKIASLELDRTLETGKCRYLSDDEVKMLKISVEAL